MDFHKSEIAQLSSCAKEPGEQYCYRLLDFDKSIKYDELSSSEESEVDECKAANTSVNSTPTSKPHAKYPQGKCATQAIPAVTTGLLVAA